MPTHYLSLTRPIHCIFFFGFLNHSSLSGKMLPGHKRNRRRSSRGNVHGRPKRFAAVSKHGLPRRAAVPSTRSPTLESQLASAPLFPSPELQRVIAPPLQRVIAPLPKSQRAIAPHIHLHSTPPPTLFESQRTFEIAPPSQLELQRTFGPRTQLESQRDIAPPSQLVSQLEIAPPSQLELQRTFAPPTQLELQPAFAPPTLTDSPVMLNGSAPHTEIELQRVIAPQIPLESQPEFVPIRILPLALSNIPHKTSFSPPFSEAQRRIAPSLFAGSGRVHQPMHQIPPPIQFTPFRPGFLGREELIQEANFMSAYLEAQAEAHKSFSRVLRSKVHAPEDVVQDTTICIPSFPDAPTQLPNFPITVPIFSPPDSLLETSLLDTSPPDTSLAQTSSPLAPMDYPSERLSMPQQRQSLFHEVLTEVTFSHLRMEVLANLCFFF